MGKKIKCEKNLIILLLFIIYGICHCYGQETCTLKNTGLSGVCKSLGTCFSVLEDLKSGRRDYTLCGYINKQLAVCCPEETYVAPPVTTPKPIPTGKSEIKCNEYAAAVYQKSYSIPLTAGSTSQQILKDMCGQKTVPLIVGGELANPREFPHMALVGFGDNEYNINWACGGTLISERYVLTAAHCINSRLGRPKYIRLGELDLMSNDDDDDPENFAINETIVYPDYKPRSNYHDIALIKLNRDVKLSPYKRPACLPTTQDSNTTKIIATGWGKTEWAGSRSEQLQKVTLNKFTEAECNEKYSEYATALPNGIDYKTQLCAGSKTEAKDTCQGDSGGPLQVYHKNEYCMYEVIGVTSLGIICGTPGMPGVYTRVFSYVDWIQRIIWD